MSRSLVAIKRQYCGALVEPDGVHFRIWAPKCAQVDVILEDGRSFPLKKNNFHFEGFIPGLRGGKLYRYRADGSGPYPDPWSNYQPEGPHGPSMIVDHKAFRWTDSGWPGVGMRGQVIYELHIGTFTPGGTFDAAAKELAELKSIGITTIEVMPVAEFPGRWNWGYDGVSLFAPAHIYGDSQAFKRFVNTAHSLGLGVILDVVYNHLGPDGNYLGIFTDDLFKKEKNEWGNIINFDGPHSKDVRNIFIQNACYWIREFHIDGLRFDATQDIHDSSPVHILAEIADRAREAAGGRSIILTSENDLREIRQIRDRSSGGYGLDATWNDDFHHAARVALTGRREAYYADYRGTPQELISCMKRGFLYQGQYHSFQKARRGTCVTNEPAEAFIHFLQNHDHVANHLHGERIHALADPALYRCMAALLLLGPETPLLFMGQEFASSRPFLFFVDHNPELGKLVNAGRKRLLSQFPSYAAENAQASIPLPTDPGTFERSRLDLAERRTHAGAYRFHQDLIRLRREDPVIVAQSRNSIDGALIADRVFAMRWFGGEHGDRLLLVNLGIDLKIDPIPEPLMAPPPDQTPKDGGRQTSGDRSGGGAAPHWSMIWSSNDVRYGGAGAVNPFRDSMIFSQGHSAVLLRSNTSEGI
jgi:maltooligosyltrehalose trehalohydrolase